jgi:hypothetical protein
MAHFSEICKDSGFLDSTPPFLVIPDDGIGLVFLIGVKALNVRLDLKFDRTNLSVTVVNNSDLHRYLMRYSENFPANAHMLSDILALAGPIRTRMHSPYGSVLLSIEGRLSGYTTYLDCVRKGSSTRLDVYPTERQTKALSFRFIRYQNETGTMTGGTTLAPPYAKELTAVLNRLYLPSANTELILKSSEFADVKEKLGDSITRDAFLKKVAPLRDPTADVTVFFVGQYKGTDDPLGEAFRNFACVVVDDGPHQYIAPETQEDEIQYSDNPVARPKSERDLHIVLAHEIAHVLGAGHNDEQDNLMSNKRQDFKFDKGTVRAINQA